MAWSVDPDRELITERAENALRAKGVPVARDSSKPPYVDVRYGGTPGLPSLALRNISVYVCAPMPHTKDKAKPPSIPYSHQIEALCVETRKALTDDGFLFQQEVATRAMPGMNEEAQKTTEAVVQSYYRLPGG